MASQRVFCAFGATSSIIEGLRQTKEASPMPTKQRKTVSCQKPCVSAQSPVDITHTVIPTMSNIPEGMYRLSWAMKGETKE